MKVSYCEPDRQYWRYIKKQPLSRRRLKYPVRAYA
jgi:hypothetical protein